MDFWHLKLNQWGWAKLAGFVTDKVIIGKELVEGWSKFARVVEGSSLGDLEGVGGWI